MAKEAITGNVAPFNTISKGCKIIGQIVADNDIRIDGVVEGEIICKGKIVTGLEGHITTGPVTCVNAEIFGVTNGDINVSDTLILRSSAKISGNIKTKILVIEPNAVFNGTLQVAAVGHNAVFHMAARTVIGGSFIADLGFNRAIAEKQIGAYLRLQKLH